MKKRLVCTALLLVMALMVTGVASGLLTRTQLDAYTGVTVVLDGEVLDYTYDNGTNLKAWPKLKMLTEEPKPIAKIASGAEGFIYIVSSLGVTGVRSSINTDIASLVKQVKASGRVPCAIGFGISTPEQARSMSMHADGVIVGSAIVKLISEHGKEAPQYVYEYVKNMVDAIR